MNALSRAVSMAVNSRYTRSLSSIIGGAFGNRNFFAGATDTKHTQLYHDYGYPEYLQFYDYYNMWLREGIAKSAVNKTIEKCWQDFPRIKEDEEAHEETRLERDIRVKLEDLMFWSNLKEVDMRSRVGEFAGVVFRYRDNKRMDEPVDRVPGGIDGIEEVIPCWEEQLIPVEYDEFENPTAFTYISSSVNPDEAKKRSFVVHASRVHIWSRNGKTYGHSVLEGCYNDLLNLVKMKGGVAEGTWKVAKQAPYLEADEDIDVAAQLRRQFGTESTEEALEQFDRQINDFQTGYDSSLLLQGIKANPVNINLPDLDKIWMPFVQSVASSVSTPTKILLGNQEGRLASDEDANEWNNTNQSRRETYVIPNIMRIIRTWVRYGILRDIDWHVEWSDLTEATSQQKADLADKMATINQKLMGTGEVAFEIQEIRQQFGETPEKPEPIDDTDITGDDSDNNSDDVDGIIEEGVNDA